MFINKTLDPSRLEDLGFELQGDVVKEKATGQVVDKEDSRLEKAKKKVINWSWVGPVVAALIFIFGWAGVISERAYTATINSDRIVQQQEQIAQQNIQIDELRKANERQEIMIHRQMQIIEKQDKILDLYNKINEDRNSDVKSHIGRLYGGLSDVKDVREKQREILIELEAIRKSLSK